VKWGVAPAILLLALAAGVAPWLAGARVETYHRQYLAALERQGLVVLGDDFRRGWLASEARTELAWPGADGLRLRLQSHIHHPSLPFVAVADSHLDWLPADAPARRLPLRLDTRIGFAGGFSTYLVPAPGWQGLRLQGCHGELVRHERLEGRLVCPELVLETVHGTLRGGFDLAFLPDDDSVDTAPQWWHQLELSAWLVLSEGLAVQMLNADATAALAVPDSLAWLRRHDLLLPKGEGLGARIRLVAGLLSVNGKTVAWPGIR
jgi:hypothetical protein